MNGDQLDQLSARCGLDSLTAVEKKAGPIEAREPQNCAKRLNMFAGAGFAIGDLPKRSAHYGDVPLSALYDPSLIREFAHVIRIRDQISGFRKRPQTHNRLFEVLTRLRSAMPRDVVGRKELFICRQFSVEHLDGASVRSKIVAEKRILEPHSRVLLTGRHNHGRNNVDVWHQNFEAGTQHLYQNMDITGPALDFVHLAAGMGVEAVRVESADDIAGAVAKAVAAGRPYLVEIAIEGKR